MARKYWEEGTEAGKGTEIAVTKEGESQGRPKARRKEAEIRIYDEQTRNGREVIQVVGIFTESHGGYALSDVRWNDHAMWEALGDH